MRIVGVHREDNGVDVANLSEDGCWLTMAGLVPPVLPGARVIRIGPNYLRHVAEGSDRDEPLPEYPTLFARWPASLPVDGAGVPVPPDEAGLTPLFLTIDLPVPQ